MTHQTQTFAIADPRDFDGDPYEVAERATLQAAGMARLLAKTLRGARLMARNAELERQLALTDECDAAAFEGGAEAKRYDALIANAEASEKALTVLSKAARFNPKAPLGRE